MRPSIFLTFLKIGLISFGGNMALVVFIEKEFVQRRRAVSESLFADAIALANLLPGPLAVNLVAYTGYQLRGWKGSFCAVGGVLLPSFFLVLLIAAGYRNFSSSEYWLNGIGGVMPVIAAIVASVGVRLVNKQRENLPGGFVLLWVSVPMVFFWAIPAPMKIVGSLGVMGVAATIGSFVFKKAEVPQATVRADHKMPWFVFALGAILPATALVIVLTKLTASWAAVLLLFSGLSLMLFGGGYVFIPLMQSVLVDSLAWVNVSQFAEGIAIGQATPGPILIGVAFLGFQLCGVLGAVVATLGIFTPSACLMILFSRYFDALRGVPRIAGAMRGVRLSVGSLIFVSAVQLLIPYFEGGVGFVFCLVAFVAIIWKDVNLLFLIALGGIAGIVTG